MTMSSTGPRGAGSIRERLAATSADPRSTHDGFVRRGKGRHEIGASRVAIAALLLVSPEPPAEWLGWVKELVESGAICCKRFSARAWFGTRR